MADSKPRRSESAGLFFFGKEMISALAMALVAIFYVIQAFRIPSGSMEKSLLVGDFLLGLKFLYGAPVVPFMPWKLPGLVDPKPGDVIIFKYPGTDQKDYIKRCVAGPGQTLRIDTMNVYVDGKKLRLPPHGQYVRNGLLMHSFNIVTNFSSLRVPAKGDVLYPDSLPVREFHFLKLLVKQENPRSSVRSEYQVYGDGEFANAYQFDMVDDWTMINDRLNYLKEQKSAELSGKQITIKQLLFLDGKRITSYTVRKDNYFMMGDNRDNSTDSRFWGFLNRNNIKAKAFILYFSWDNDAPLWAFWAKIRWNRIGMLIRSWNGAS